MKTIMIVEDDTSIGEFLVLALAQETCYHPVLVSNGSQALKIAQEARPQLFILDYRLPGMSGIELYDQLHAHADLAHIPALVLGAHFTEEAIEEVESRKVYRMDKPFELDEFLDTIKAILTVPSELC